MINIMDSLAIRKKEREENKPFSSRFQILFQINNHDCLPSHQTALSVEH
jgi:hypothetical protein